MFRIKSKLLSIGHKTGDLDFLNRPRLTHSPLFTSMAAALPVSHSLNSISSALPHGFWTFYSLYLGRSFLKNF